MSEKEIRELLEQLNKFTPEQKKVFIIRLDEELAKIKSADFPSKG